MVVFISPIGYDSTRITRPILSEGVNDDDAIELLRPDTEDEDKRAVEAIADIERMIQQVQPEVSVRTHHITHREFSTAVLECSDMITSSSDDIVINLGGGPREIYLALVTATLAHLESISKTLQFSDLDGSVFEITLPMIVGGVPNSALETLHVIVENESGISIPALSERLGMAKSSVSRHVQQLEAIEAVSAEMQGKTKVVEPTFSGRLRARMETATDD